LGDWLASRSTGGLVQVWGIRERKLVRTHEGLHQSPVDCLAISRAGTFALSAGESGRLRVWNTADWTASKTVTAHKTAIAGITVSANDELVATASYDGSVKLWRLHYLTQYLTLGPFSRRAFAAEFAPDCEHLLTGNWNNRIQQRGAHTEKLVMDIAAHNNLVLALALPPDGTVLASGSVDRTVKLWGMPDGRFIQAFGVSVGKKHGTR